MRLNLTSVWKVMTIWISQLLLLLYFEHLDILCAWIGPPCEKIWPFEFLESFRCSILNISICGAPESDIRVKSNDHLNFSTTSVVQFWACRYIMRLNLTSVWKVMTIWISWELLLFNGKHLDILCAWIWAPFEKLWPFEFFNCSLVIFLASRYIMRLNRTSVWKDMAIWISRELLLFNFEHLYMWCAWIGPPSDK